MINRMAMYVLAPQAMYVLGGQAMYVRQVIQAIVTQVLILFHIYRCVNKMDKHILLNRTFFQNVQQVDIYALFLNKFLWNQDPI
jgi:hypothetical protein